MKHIKSHSSTPIYACDICHEGARSMKHLQCHKINVHNIYNTKIYRYGCTICSKRFKNRSALTSHENTHLVSSGRLENIDVSEDDMDSQIRNEYLTDKAENDLDFNKDSSLLSEESIVTESKLTGDSPVVIENSSAINNSKEDFMETLEGLSGENVEDYVADTDKTGDVMSESDVASNSSTARPETPTNIEDQGHSGDQLRNFIDKFVADKVGYNDEKITEDTECIEDNSEENYELKSYKCDLCSHEFEGCKAIKAHMLQHNNLKPHHCARCDLYFVLARNMRTHLIQHEVEDPLVCQLCNEVFHTNEGLNNHNLTHLEYFPFKCDVCQRGFQIQSTYNLHMRFHNNTAFECSLCQESFPSKSSLQTHVRNKHFIYDKRYRFGCDHCQMKFRGSDVLKRHKRYSHNISWSELIPKKLRKQFQRKRGGKGFL